MIPRAMGCLGSPTVRSLVDIDGLVDLTSALVAVDTRNPPGNERAAGAVCREALAPWGATVQEVLGRPARRFDDWIAANLEALRT